MKLRILAGDSAGKDQVTREKLKTFYKSEKLWIQGDEDVMTIDLADGRQAFCAGRLIGIRTSQDEIFPCSWTSTNLRDLIRDNSIEKCQEMLEGRFLLAVAGPGNNCYLCADRYGQRDLYYQSTDHTQVFASDLALLPLSLTRNGFDQAGLVHTLTVYGYRPPKRHTLYRSVRRLGIREIAHISDERASLSELPFQPIFTGNYGERELHKYADLLLDAIRVHGSRNGNVVYLSSGWDSTSILACLVHLFGPGKVRAAIGRMQYAERSGVINQFELDRAKAVADYYGVRLDIVEFDYRHRIPSLLDHLKPFCKSHHITIMNILTHGILADFVAKTTDGDEAVFVGEISDGVHNLGFSQFTTIFHPVLSFREYSDKMASYLFGPTFLKFLQSGQFLTDPVYNLLRRQAGEAKFDDPAPGGSVNRTLQLLASFFLRAKRLPLWSLRNNKMLTDKGITEYSQEMESQYLRLAAEKATPETIYSWYLHLYNSFHWQSSAVATLPLTAEVYGLNMALPFWDCRIQEFLSGMPEEWGRGLDLNPTKYPLKWMLKNRIDYPLHLQVGPHSYLYDINPSFSHAAEIMFGSAFVPYFKDLLRSKSYRDLLSPEIFNLDYIDDVVNGYLQSVEIKGAELSDLLALCMLSMIGWYGE